MNPQLGRHRLWVVCLAGLLLAPSIAAAGGASLYSQVSQATRREFLLPTASGSGAERVAERFAAGAYTLDEGTLTVSDVEKALAGGDDFCTASGTHPELPQFTLCQRARSGIESLVRREEGTRAFGRQLQMLASPFVWTQTMETTLGETDRPDPQMQTVPEGDDLLTGKFQSLGAVLQSLVTESGTNTEELTAAVWRYGDGLKAVQDGTADAPFANTNLSAGALQNIPARWPEVERVLGELQDTLPLTIDTSTLKPGNHMPLSFPPSYWDWLPENVGAQAMLTKEKNGDVTADTALFWLYPVEPVLPSLCGKPHDPATPCNPILPGQYPPPLDDGEALCAHPTSKIGYLCRPFEKDGTACDAYNQETYPTIHLTDCHAREPVKDAVLKPYCPRTCPVPPTDASARSCDDVALTVKPAALSSAWDFAPYRPSDFYSQADTAACDGITSQTPPVLCNDARRQIRAGTGALDLIQWLFSQQYTPPAATKPEQPAVDLEKAFVDAEAGRLQGLRDRLQTLTDDLE